MAHDLIERLRAQTLSTEDAVAPCSVRGDADLINEAADAIADHCSYREQRIEEEVVRRCSALRAENERLSQGYFMEGAKAASLKEETELLRARIAELEGVLKSLLDNSLVDQVRHGLLTKARAALAR